MARVTVAEIIGDRLRQAMEQAFREIQPDLDQIARDGGGAAARGITGDIGLITQVLSDVALGLLVLDPPVGAGVGAFKAVEDAGGKWAVGTALGYMAGYTLFSDLMPVNQPLQHAIAAGLTNEIHDPQTSADLVARGFLDHGHGADEAAGSGFDTDHFNRMVKLAQTRPDLGTAIEMMRRGIRDRPATVAALEALGYAPATAALLVELDRTLLSPPDLALAELRGHITRDQALAYLPLTGLNATDYETLVANTGEPLGLQELLEAFRRGFIDQGRLDRGIRQSRIRDEWIDVAHRLRYAPMSTEEAVRGVVQNYLTENEGRAISQQNGLLPEHWTPLRLSFGRPLAHMEMASLVHRGLASRAQFDQAMRESDMKDKYIGLSFEVASRLLPERLIVDAIKYGALSMKDGAIQLMEMGYDQDRAAILLKLGLRESQSVAHGLTKSDITRLYSEHILSRDDTISHLVALGFTRQDATLEIELIDVAAHAKEVAAEQAVVRVNYLAGSIDAVKAEAELRHIGLSHEQAQHSIQVWDHEKRRANRTLSESQVVKAAKEGVFKPDEAISLLVGMGYSRANAATLLRENGIPLGQ